MSNDPRGRLALGALTAMVNNDHDGYLAVTDQFDGVPEALAAMSWLAHMLVEMLAESHGRSLAEMLRQVGIAMAAAEQGLDGTNT